MEMPHTFDHYSVAVTKNNGARERTLYLQDEDVPCFYQPAASVSKQATQRADIEQETGKVYLLNGAVWEDAALGNVIKVAGVNVWLLVVGRKNLCELSKVFRLDVIEDLTQEFNVE